LLSRIFAFVTGKSGLRLRKESNIMATLQLPDSGQTLTLDDQIAQDDTLLRQALALVYPAVANAEIKRENKMRAGGQCY